MTDLIAAMLVGMVIVQQPSADDVQRRLVQFLAGVSAKVHTWQRPKLLEGDPYVLNSTALLLHMANVPCGQVEGVSFVDVAPSGAYQLSVKCRDGNHAQAFDFVLGVSSSGHADVRSWDPARDDPRG